MWPTLRGSTRRRYLLLKRGGHIANRPARATHVRGVCYARTRPIPGREGNVTSPMAAWISVMTSSHPDSHHTPIIACANDAVLHLRVVRTLPVLEWQGNTTALGQQRNSPLWVAPARVRVTESRPERNVTPKMSTNLAPRPVPSLRPPTGRCRRCPSSACTVPGGKLCDHATLTVQFPRHPVIVLHVRVLTSKRAFFMLAC